MKPMPNQNLVGLDNFTRKPDDETQLNDLFQSVFKQPNGKQVLEYLKTLRR